MNKGIKTVLILGANGMLGNCVSKYFNQFKDKYNIIETISNKKELKDSNYRFLTVDNNIIDTFTAIYNEINPDIIINCIGFIRPNDADVEDVKKSFLVNSYFPKVISIIAKKSFIYHVSTDCVFNGKKGSYVEESVPDELNVYGMSKFLGQLTSDNSVTLRTSIIGIEQNTTRNLLNWFLSQSNSVKGFKRVYWNGITTLVLSKIIEFLISNDNPINNRIVHIQGESLSKYDILNVFKDVFSKDIAIIPEDSTKSDKTIVAKDDIKTLLGHLIPSFYDQVSELKNFYEKYNK